MLFHLRLKNIGVKIFERIILLANVRYSHGPSLNYHFSLFLRKKFSKRRKFSKNPEKFSAAAAEKDIGLHLYTCDLEKC